MDPKSPRLIYLKAALFLLIGGLAATALLLEHPSWKVTVLLALTVWSFARLYYFAFYVIERYVDPSFKFSGLFDFARYLMTKGKHR